MAQWKRYRSKVLVESKELDHAGHLWDARSGSKQPFAKGDMLVRAPGSKEQIISRERFLHDYEPVPD